MDKNKKIFEECITNAFSQLVILDDSELESSELNSMSDLGLVLRCSRLESKSNQLVKELADKMIEFRMCYQQCCVAKVELAKRSSN